MAYRVIASDSEDEHDTRIQQNKPFRNTQVITDSSDEDEDSSNITSFTSTSSDVYSEPEVKLDETFSPVQGPRKRFPKQQKILLSDDEEPGRDAPENNLLHSKTANNDINTHEGAGREEKDDIKETKVITDSSGEEDGPNINSFTSASSDVNSEPEVNLDETFSPMQVLHKRFPKQQRILLSDDEENDPLPIQPVSNKEKANDRDTPDLHSETANNDINTHEGAGREEKDDSKETNKENKSPLSHNLPSGKPVTVPMLEASLAKPLSQPPVMPTKVTAQRQISTYQLACTRPALLKQLDNIKGLKARLGENLPDKGANLARLEKQIIDKIASIKGGDLTLMQYNQNKDNIDGSTHQGGWAKNRILAQQYKHLTNDVVEQLHSTMQSRPASEAEVGDPRELKTSLMPHQRRALAWALWRETQTPSGGILADDMGLGKTLTMLSLILGGRERRKSSGESLSRYCPTLVVCPASLMQQWDREVSIHVRTGQLKVLVYHANSRVADPRRLSQFDVVITTYGVVGSEGAAYLPDDSGQKPKRKAAHCTLFEVQWERIILDEGHTIKNPKTNASLGVCGLTSTHRWVLTGTPVHNSLKDVYSLVKFLRLAPFSEYTVWKELVQKTGVGMQRLQTLMQSLLLRRTKEEIGSDGQPLIQLPSKTVITHSVSLNEDEQCVFDLLFVQCRSKFLDYLREIKQGVDGGKATAIEMPELPSYLSDLPSIMSRLFASVSNSNTAIVLVTILRLLQCSCHLGLLSRAMEVDCHEVDSLETQLATMSLSAADSTSSTGGVGRSWPAQGKLPQCFNVDMSSSKVTVLLEVLRDVLRINDSDRPPKCVLVSQWSTFLDIIEKHVRKAGFTFVRIDGSVPPKRRNFLIEEFNSHRAHPQLLLMTLKTGGVGLNLSRGSHLFLMDLHWNPALEQQAADRIHRLGQISDVTIHRFLCTKTAEEKVVQIQESKKKLATDVLSCTTSMGSKNKLTLDLKLLFSV